MGNDFTRDLPDEAATLSFGADLAKAIQANLTIYLHGDLGAGKTTLVRGLLHALGYVGKVKSPTYTLVESYEVDFKEQLSRDCSLDENVGKDPFVVSLSNHELPFDKLRANGNLANGQSWLNNNVSRLTVYHFDLYRFNDDEEWEAAGFREHFNAQSVCLIEWPEKAENVLPAPDLNVTLAIKDSGRRVSVSAHSMLGQQCLQVISKEEK